MATTGDLRPSVTPFDPFLTAPAGDDPSGRAVSVLSFLARIGVDPWETAAALSRMAPDTARQHLAGLMERQGDLVGPPGTLALRTRHLIGLLPEAQAGLDPRPQRDTGPRPGFGTILAVVVVLVLAARWFLGA